MTRPGNYGDEFLAVAVGMKVIHASERADSGARTAYATFPSASPREIVRPFEITARAVAGPNDDRPACEGVDPEIFFPANGDVAVMRMVRQICARCPRRSECLADGASEAYGVWGGQTVTERKLRKARRA